MASCISLRGTCVAASTLSRPSAPIRTQHIARRQIVVTRSLRERDDSDSFVTGFVLGGVIFGTLGFLFAPQISKSLLGDDDSLKLPKFMEEEKDPEQTKQELIDKIAQLNKSIDDVAFSLKPKEAVPEGASPAS